MTTKNNFVSKRTNKGTATIKTNKTLEGSKMLLLDDIIHLGENDPE